MAGYNTKDFLKDKDSVVIGATEANIVVDKFRMSELDSKEITVVITASSVTVGTAITAKLQHSYDGGIVFTNADTQAIAGNGNISMTFSYVAGTNTGLGPLARIEVATGSGDAVTIDNVWITRRT